MYSVLAYNIPQDADGGYLEIQDGIEFDGIPSWSLGEKFVAPLPDPININLVPISGFSGEPSEMYDGNICLMSERLVSALTACGVDNLDHFPAVLRNVNSGQTYTYRAVNIIGLVAAADLGQSTWSSHDGDARIDVDFDQLAVDPGKAHGLLLFRLAENTHTIVIHEKVKNHLIAVGFPTLRFVEPTDWAT